MRTSDPAAYDDFTPLTTTVKLNTKFRGLLVTHSAALSVSFSIDYSRVSNLGVVTVQAKTLVVNIPAGDTLFIPISGDAVTATFSGGNVYALI